MRNYSNPLFRFALGIALLFGGVAAHAVAPMVSASDHVLAHASDRIVQRQIGTCRGRS